MPYLLSNANRLEDSPYFIDREEEMNTADIDRLVGRIERVRAATEKKSGPGFQYGVPLPEGKVQSYTLKNVKCPEVIEDELAQLFVWVWSLKDYLKELVVARGGNKQVIEDVANSNRNLQLCADLANREKAFSSTAKQVGIIPQIRQTQVYNTTGKHSRTQVRRTRHNTGCKTIESCGVVVAR